MNWIKTLTFLTFLILLESGYCHSQNHTDVIHFSNIFGKHNGCVLVYGSFEWSFAPRDFLIEDCRNSWKLIKSFDSVGRIQQLDFVNDHTAWGILSGRIAKFEFDDKGFSATTFDHGDTIFKDLDFVNENDGWACGKDGVILKTLNGGKTWNKIKSGTNGELHKISFTDRKIGWVLAKPPAHKDQGFRGVLITKDGGQSWKKISFPHDQDLSTVYFTSHVHGCGLLNTSELLCTWDGNTWQSTSVPAESRSGIYFVDSKNGWIVGNSIMKTIDGGRTWKYSDADKINNLNLDKVYFDNKNLGWAWDGLETYKTRDGGETWEKISDEWLPLLEKLKRMESQVKGTNRVGKFSADDMSHGICSPSLK